MVVYSRAGLEGGMGKNERYVDRKRDAAGALEYIEQRVETTQSYATCYILTSAFGFDMGFGIVFRHGLHEKPRFV